MPFMNIAHRGFSAQYPENTLLAFQKALDLGVTWIEFDLQVTQDGHLVVMHDHTLDRTTDGAGAVSDLPLDRILTLDAGAKYSPEFAGEHVPTFEATLDLLSGVSRLVVELKFEGMRHIRPVVETLRRHDLLDRVSISSFDLSQLPRVKSYCPQLSTTALINPAGRPGHNWVREALSLGVDTFGPRCSETTREWVDGAHAAGLAVRCWGLGRDRSSEMERLIELGVDGMTTDCPDILQDILRLRNML